MDYESFLKDLDTRLELYFQEHQSFIHCKSGCSFCCEKGDYPMSDIELRYLMKGYAGLDNETKILVQANIKTIKKGGTCPFLINQKCSVYQYRPIICRVHGLAYLCKENTVKLPYCTNNGLNYSQIYEDGEITINPITENLDTPNLIKEFLKTIEPQDTINQTDYVIKNLYDWLK